ncbi:MAG: hypothetical protein HOI95_11280 [Chromatiales bacterium]|jgi:hypothetical protein|nr:hypothetical protein [Chromatiales bacterium]
MSDASPAHKSDFDALYDLADPCAYFRGLAPSAYRMPEVIARAANLRPWFVCCPGPETDWQPLQAVWESLGYTCESLFATPVRDRKPLSEYERTDIVQLADEFGLDESRTFADGFILVDAQLARSHADALQLPVASMRPFFEELLS